MIDILPTTLVTVHGLASAAGLPAPTVARRLEKLGIEPDEILHRGAEAPAPLFRGNRAAEIIRNLQQRPE